MRGFLFGIITFLLFATSQDFNLSGAANKKLKKACAELYGDLQVNTEELDIQSTELSFSVEDKRLFALSSETEKLGFVYMAKARSLHNVFDYAVIFDTTLSIDKALVLVYREDQGGEIGSKRWLRQFEDKSSAHPIKMGDDIQGISGATVSCRSATMGIKQMTEEIQTFKKLGLLD